MHLHRMLAAMAVMPLHKHFLELLMFKQALTAEHSLGCERWELSPCVHGAQGGTVPCAPGP